MSWPEPLAELRIKWEKINVMDLMLDVFLSEALDNPYLSELDRERVKKRLAEKGKAA